MRNQLYSLRLCLLFLMVTIVLSCQTKEDDYRKLSDLTDEDLHTLIKLNFLKEYGGIELERYEICKLPIMYSDICEVDTAIVVDRKSPSYFDISLKGELKISCPEYNETFNRIASYYDKGSVGSSSIDDIQQEYDMQSSVTIAGNTDENVYISSVNSHRNLKFNNPSYKNIGSHITFYTNFCPFDHANCELGEITVYTVRLYLYSKVDWDSTVEVKGKIRKVNDVWVLTTVQGKKVELE